MNKDVELIIRMRDQASKTAESLTAALRAMADAQVEVGQSAGRTDSLLTQLAREFQSLDSQVKGFSALGQVAGQMDKAAAAVGRLEQAAAAARAEEARLLAEQSKGAANAAKMAQAAEASKAALEAQRATAASVRSEAGRTSAAYLEQKAAVQQAVETNKEAERASKAAGTAQRGLEAAVRRATDSAEAEEAALAAARTEFEHIRSAALAAGQAMGNVVVSQDAISAAAKRAKEDLDRVGAALSRQQSAGPDPVVNVAPAAQATANYRAQVEAVRLAGQAFDEARNEASRLGREIAKVDAPTRELATAFLLAKDAAQQANAEYRDQVTTLNAMKGAQRGGFAAFDQLAQSLRTTPGTVRKVGDAVEDVGDAVEAASKKRKGEALFGLRPYELQNLSYQVNDLITQVASGTAPSQAFAQQFGQIVQIFPKLGAVILPILPELIGVGAALAVVAAAAGNVADKASSIRSFGAQLTASADGASHNAESLADSAHALDVFGTSLKVAREEIAIFVQAGLDDSKIESFGRTTQNMSDVLGITIPDAAKKLSEGLTGGYASVKKLDDALNFLTRTERDHIRALFDSGKAEEARAQAFEILSGKMESAAAQARGPWSEAIKNLTQAWDNFLAFLADSGPIQDMIGLLGDLARAARDASANLPGAKGPSAVTGNPQLDREIQQLDRLEEKRRKLANETFGQRFAQSAADGAGNALKNQIPLIGPLIQNKLPANRNAELAQLDQQIESTKKRVGELRAGIADADQAASEAEKKAGADVLQTYQDQYDALKGINDQRRIAIAGEKAYNDALEKGAAQADANKVRELAERTERVKVDKENEAKARAADSRARAAQARLDSLQNKLATEEGEISKRVAEGQVANLDARLKVITDARAKVLEELKRFEKLGGKDVNGETLADYRARLDANSEILKQQETLKFYGEQLAALDKQRDDKLKSIADRFADGTLSAADAFRQESDANASLQQQISSLAATAEDFAKSIRGATPDPKLEAFIERMDRLRSAPSTGPKSDSGKAGQAMLGAEERKLNDIIAARNDLIATETQLRDQGVVGWNEWRAAVQDAYAQSTPEIDKQIAAMKALLDKLLELQAITPQAYDAWIAKMQLAGAEARNLSETQVLSVTDANNMLAESGTRFFDLFAEGLANGQSAVQAFGSAFLQVAADFMREISLMIIKQALLNAVMQSGAGANLSSGINNLFNAAPLLTAAGAVAFAGETITTGATALGIAATALQGAATTLLVANSMSVLHGGGIAGAPSNRTRMISPMVFAGAPRFHKGGVVGIARDEVPAILQRGEEVITRNDPRHVLNGGGQGGGGGDTPLSLRNVLVMDPSQLAAALSGPAGEKVIMTHVMANAAAIKQRVTG